MSFKNSLHRRLSRNDARLRLAFYGILTGLLTALVISLFRFVLEQTMPLVTSGQAYDDFESLPAWTHFFLPLLGCSLIGLILHKVGPEGSRMGVAYVISKVHNFNGLMPLRNGVMQFITATLAILSGCSCGREGPSIHLGATAGGILGSRMQLPNNSRRMLIACGSAAAISAFFNTPLAGVVFAMEVIMMEYSVISIIPVIVASVSAAVVTRIFYGDHAVFVIETVEMSSLWELPYIALSGLLIGLLATAFILIHKYTMHYSSVDVRKRLLLAGLLTGSLALFLPEIMGMGYDSLNAALRGDLTLKFLLVLAAGKLLISSVGLGLGLPGGAIGPSLVIGGVAGAAMGLVGDLANADFNTSPSLYVLLGMCAMMGAVLQAPFAAMVALLELTQNPSTILPAMLIIVVANLTSSEIFGQKSIFENSLQHMGSALPKNMSRLLSHYGVSSILKPNVLTLGSGEEDGLFEAMAEKDYDWLLLDSTDEQKLLFDLSADSALADMSLDAIRSGSDCVMAISIHATLLEAMQKMQESGSRHAYVFSPVTIGKSNILGIISLNDIINFYRDR